MEFNFDRVRRAAVFAFMLHVFIASVNKRKQHSCLIGGLILSPSGTASS
jgi:hypothetical protein